MPRRVHRYAPLPLPFLFLLLLPPPLPAHASAGSSSSGGGGGGGGSGAARAGRLLRCAAAQPAGEDDINPQWRCRDQGGGAVVLEAVSTGQFWVLAGADGLVTVTKTAPLARKDGGEGPEVQWVFSSGAAAANQVQQQQQLAVFWRPRGAQSRGLKLMGTTSSAAPEVLSDSFVGHTFELMRAADAHRRGAMPPPPPPLPPLTAACRQHRHPTTIRGLLAARRYEDAGRAYEHFASLGCMEVTLDGLFYGVCAAAPLLQPAPGLWGMIVNLAGTLGLEDAQLALLWSPLAFFHVGTQAERVAVH
jgi:hypothetical protein